MNVVFLLLATAAGTGSPPLPPPSAASCSDGCGSATAACDSCCDKPSLCDRLRAKFAKKGDCCEPAPKPCCTPAPAPCCKPAPEPCCKPAPTPCCEAKPVCCEDPCAKPCLISRLKGFFAKKGHACCETPTCCGDAPAAIGAPAPAAHSPAPVYHPAPSAGHPAPAQHHPYPIVNPAPAGNGGHVVTPIPANTGGNVNNPKPLPSGKTVEPIQKAPMEEKDAKPAKKEDARLLPTPVVRPAAATVETEVKHPFDSARRHGKRMGHAADFSRLTGELSYVHADGGLWVLRFASIDVEGAKGGSVILARDRVMNSYREGDLVTVEGQIISERGSARLGGSLYRVREIVLVDRQR